MKTPINQMTLDEVKEQVAKQFTGGKHTWHSGYLNKSIKVILMDDVAELYATQFKMDAAQLQADKAELLEALEKANNTIKECDWSENEGFPKLADIYIEIESLIQKHKL